MRARMLSIGALALVACGGSAPPKAAPADVPGWYVRTTPDGREVIDIRPDGNYVHLMLVQGEPTRTDAARWHASGDSAVTLTFYRPAAEIAHGPARPDSVRAYVHPMSNGELRLDVPPDTAGFTRRLRYAPKRGG